MSLQSTRKRTTTTQDPEVDGDAAADTASPDSPSSNKPKRTRVSRACDQCRVEKEKCEGERPCCQTCITAGRACTYVREQKKRGPRTGSVRAVERTLAWIFDVVPGAEERTAAMLANGELARRLLLDKSSEDHERLQRKWVSCRVNRRIQLLLSGIDTADDKEGSPEGSDSVVWQVQEQVGRGNKEVGAMAVTSRESLLEPASKSHDSHRQQLDGIQRPHVPWTSQHASIPRDLETQPSTTAPVHVDCAGGRTGGLPHSHPLSLTLPHNYARLLQIYHSYTHCWFPITDYSKLYNTAAQYPRGGGLVVDPLSPLGADHAELWGALALASLQDACAARAYDGGHRMKAQLPPRPSEIYATARNLVPNEDGSYGLGHINALLFLTMINIGQNNNQRAYMLVGMAIRLVAALNLHEVPVEDQHFFQKQYVIACCFILETLVCAVLGRIKHLKSSQIRPRLPFQADLPDEYEHWISCPSMDTRGGTGSTTYPPAQSYSALTQIYRFFRLLDHAMEQPVQDPKHALAALAESVDYAYSSCNSIVPASPAMLAVPSTFLVHTTFLTVAIFMATSRTTSQLFLLLELLETHASAFGVASSSPLLVGYMNLVGGLHLFESLGSALATRWDSVAAMFQAVWIERQENGDQHSQKTTAVWSHTHMESLPHISEVTPRAAVGAAVHGSFDNSAIGRQTIPDHSHQRTELDPQADTGSGTHVVGTGPDFDAALAEIAEIDPFDSMDAQNEFLANLGFGPGFNMSDLLGADVDFAS